MNETGQILTVSTTLVRPTASGPELFWARRCPDRAFLGGFHAFFAGSIETHDADIESAALRECFEECGLLLSEGGLRRVPFEARSPKVFADACPTLAYSRLQPLGVWTTPKWLTPSFCTSFFGVLLTEEEGSRLDDLSEGLDGREFDDGWWVSPSTALRQWWTGRAFATTPIRLIIESLKDAPDRSKSLPKPKRLGTSPANPGTSQSSQICGGIVLIPLETLTLPPATHTNTIVAGHERFIIIDPGAPDEKRLEPLLNHLDDRRRRGHQCVGVALTHHHRDHTGGLEVLSHHLDAPLYAHPETLKRLGEPPLNPTPITEGQHIDIDHPGPLRAVFTPGHAPGHLAFFQGDTKLLFAGDLMASYGTIIIDPPDGNMGDYLRSLRRIRKLAPRSILCAHGPLVTAPRKLIDRYLEHRQMREQKVLTALRETGPARATDLVAQVYAEAPRAVWPLAERSLLSHLQHLVEQDLARYEDDAFIAQPVRPGVSHDDR